MTTPELLARRFHNLYEHMAPQFGYTTREDTRLFIPESPNGKLMIAVCEALASSPEVAALIAEARRGGWSAAKEAAEKACDPSSYQAHHASVRRRCQTAIRALKETTP